MPPEQTGARKIWRINMLQLHSLICAFLGWISWPDRFVNLGWGFLSVIMWLTAVLSFVTALREMYGAYRRDKVVAEYKAQGRKQRSAQMAGSDKLENAGMR